MEKKGLIWIIAAISALIVLLLLSLVISATALDWIIPAIFYFFVIVVPIVLIVLVIMLFRMPNKKKPDFFMIEQSIKRCNEYLQLKNLEGAKAEYQNLINQIAAASRKMSKDDMDRFKSEGIKIYQKIANFSA
jgi:DNA integrity scanning protein DisA with diadenylate cyclase activity